MLQSIIVTILLTTASSIVVECFLFTPKFQLYLNQMKQYGHNDFVFAWDFTKKNCYNGGFSYTTNQNGKI